MLHAFVGETPITQVKLGELCKPGKFLQTCVADIRSSHVQTFELPERFEVDERCIRDIAVAQAKLLETGQFRYLPEAFITHRSAGKLQVRQALQLDQR